MTFKKFKETFPPGSLVKNISDDTARNLKSITLEEQQSIKTVMERARMKKKKLNM